MMTASTSTPKHPAHEPLSTKRLSEWAVDNQTDFGFFGPDSISWRVLAAPAVSLMIAQITNLLEAPHIDFQSILLDHDPLYPTNTKKQRTWRGDPTRRVGESLTGALIAYERYVFRGLKWPARLPAEMRDRFFAETAELAVLMGVSRERIPVTARQVDEYYRGQTHMYRTRKGYFGNQLRTAASQFRFTSADSVVTVAADIVLLASTFLVYSAIPRPCRRQTAKLNGARRDNECSEVYC